MKIKINQKLQDSEGNEIIMPGKPAMTLKDVIVSSVLQPKEQETQEVKYEKYALFKRIKEAKIEADSTIILDIKIEELSLIKKAIGELQPPLIMGQCFDLLENTESVKANKK
jgi:hypothetical protein